MVNIVVDVPEEHIASIYALILSIITNKYNESIYNIYLSGFGEDSSQLDSLLAIQTDTVRIIPVTEGLPSIPIGEAIRLYWNMIVIGDLTELSEKVSEDDDKETCSNTSYENDNIILRSDIDYNPEEYFDHPFAGQWLKYYKLSPLKDTPLRRRSYIETQGEISIRNPEFAVPVAISTCDRDVPSTVALLNSIRANTLSVTQLDIRIFYRNLSKEHASLLLSFKDDNTSVVLYNVKRCQETKSQRTKFIPVLSAFDEYDTVVYMDSKCICLDDMAYLFRNGADPYDVRVVGDIPEAMEMPGMMILNSVSWIQNDISSRYVTLSKRYDRFQEIMQLAGGKRVGNIQSFSMYSFRNEDNPWMNIDSEASRVEWSYLSLSPDFEQLMDEALAYDQQKEVADMQELLQQLNNLEIENNRLKQEMKFLNTDNQSLRAERDQYLYELMETRKSFTYRIGRAITFLPRKLRRDNGRRNKGNE